MRMLTDLPTLCYPGIQLFVVYCESVRPVTKQLQCKAACYGPSLLFKLIVLLMCSMLWPNVLWICSGCKLAFTMVVQVGIQS